MGNPHVLTIPYPAQGHVIPLLELSQCLVEDGIRVTFVNTDFIHQRVLNALGDKASLADGISLVSIPDGLEPEQDRKDLVLLSLTIGKVMSGKLEELIERINSSGEDDKVTCVIADGTLGWSLDVAETLSLPRASIWPASAATLTSVFSIPKLLEDGVIDENGTPLKKEKIQLAPNMLSMNPADFFWACIGDKTTDKIMFDIATNNCRAMLSSNWIVCNSVYEYEAGTFTYFPNILPIGPLLASNRLGDTIGNFWLEESSCMKWLDQQLPNSVVYVAFGSFTVFDRTQFPELALGLELSDRPFLWVVRPDLTSKASDAFPGGFQERVVSKGRLVGWVPQQKVLSHPSISCFVSHCGWNSTMEGACNGVPFLCWPYFADQLSNESYICDFWKVGLRLSKNDNGIITREENKNKVDQLVGNQGFRTNVLGLKDLAMKNVSQDGQSNKNFKNLVNWIKLISNS